MGKWTEVAVRATSNIGDCVRLSRAPLARIGPIENFRTMIKRSCVRGINQRLRCAPHPVSKTTKTHRRRESSHPGDASSSSELSHPDPDGRIVVERIIARESHPNWTANTQSSSESSPSTNRSIANGGHERDHATDGSNTTINPNRAAITSRIEGQISKRLDLQITKAAPFGAA